MSYGGRRACHAIGLALVVTLVASGCGNEAVITEDGKDIRFQSGDFELVGDLNMPDGAGPFPAVIIVHGDGPQTRSSTPGTTDILRIFGEAGFAVFAWDKPGSGSSTGEFEQGQTLRQRAEILVTAVKVIVNHPDIDGKQVGLWGISQAGWVMPLALEKTDEVAFMIIVSGGGEDSIEQLAYQLGQNVVCNGQPAEQGETVEEHFPETAKGPTYQDYLAAMDHLVNVQGWQNFAGPTMKTEEEWQPWPADIDAYFDPITVIEQTRIPVVAVFGDMDRFVDPLQGATAYEEALQTAGNSSYQVELLPGVGHTMLDQSTMCGTGGTTSERYLELLSEWATRLKR